MSSASIIHDLAKMIEHSLLHPTMTDAEIVAGCSLAEEYDVAADCVKPNAIQMKNEILTGSDVKTCAVIGFPHGNTTSEIKVAEAEGAVNAGATEIDMVVNISKALGGDWSYVAAEIKAIN